MSSLVIWLVKKCYHHNNKSPSTDTTTSHFNLFL